MEKNQNKTKLSIVIPVLNEGVNLRILLKILNAIVDVPHEVLVVYDIADDDSIPVVKTMQKDYPGLRLIHNKLGRGVINAIKSGVNASRGDYAITIAADDIGPPLAIHDMFSLMEQGCDIVNATRYAYGGKNIGGSFVGTLLSITANKLFYSASAFTDPTFGVKMFRRSLFNQLSLESKPVGWAVSFEFAIKSQLAGWKLGEVPLISLNRLYGGKSSFRFRPWVAEYTKWFFWGLKNYAQLRKNRHVTVKIPSNFKK